MASKINSKKYKYKRKYRCVYCNQLFERDKMVKHILDKHDDLLQPNDDVNKIVFDLVNNPKRQCVMCKNKVDWNPTKLRYERLCNNPECKRRYKDMMYERTQNIYNKTPADMLRDPEFQAEMLANRTISGTYKFDNNDTIIYTGSYELEFIKFLDQVMGFKSEDIMAPGPVISYRFRGKSLNWITDFYLPQYNLIVEVKDGGSNPNKRTMEEYREKQLEKEKAIIKDGKYNYLRLTNKEHEQFIEMLMAIKNSLYEENNNVEFKSIILINEDNKLVDIFTPNIHIFK